MFSELRAYEPGDDVRHLDWNVTARQGRPYVRRYHRGAGPDPLADRRRLGEPPVRARRPRARPTAPRRRRPCWRRRRSRTATASAWPWSATGSRPSCPPAGGPAISPGSCGRWSPPRPPSRRDRSDGRPGPAPPVGRRALIVVRRFPGDEPVGAWRQVVAAASRSSRSAARRPPRGGAPRSRPARPGRRRDRARRVVDAGSPRVRAAYAEAASGVGPPSAAGARRPGAVRLRAHDGR